jgi:hypothetical protein
MSMERRDPIRMVRVLRHPSEDDGSFALEFRERVGPEGRFAAAWEMTAEVDAIRGERGDQPRLQRSVVRLIRR